MYLPRIFPVGADIRQILKQQLPDLSIFDTLYQEIPTGDYCIGNGDFLHVLPPCLRYFHAAYNKHCVVIKNEPGIKFLDYEFPKAGVEIVESNIIFQIPIGGFYPPARMIDFLTKLYQSGLQEGWSTGIPCFHRQDQSLLF